MADIAGRDVNYNPAIQGASTLDNKTSTNIGVNPTNHALQSEFPLTPLFATISASSSGDNTIITGVSTKQIRVLNGLLYSSSAVNIFFRDAAAGTALTGTMNLPANGGFQIPFSPVGNFQTSASNALVLNLSSTVAVGGWVTYVTV